MQKQKEEQSRGVVRDLAGGEREGSCEEMKEKKER